MTSASIDRVLNRTVSLPEEKLGAPYLEIRSTYAVHNRYLRIMLLGACFVIVGMIAAFWNLSANIGSIRPIVVRVDPNGNQTAGSYSTLGLSPRTTDLKRVLREFTLAHYSRSRTPGEMDKANIRKLMFVSEDLANRLTAEERQGDTIAKFLASKDEPEVEVVEKLISLEDVSQQPYRAIVDFEKVFRGPDGRELKRIAYRAHFTVIQLAEVPPHIDERVNAFGLFITKFREDEALQ
jgi:hypothetical protein